MIKKEDISSWYQSNFNRTYAAPGRARIAKGKHLSAIPGSDRAAEWFDYYNERCKIIEKVSVNFQKYGQERLKPILNHEAFL
jgi:hypothetical protein